MFGNKIGSPARQQKYKEAIEVYIMIEKND